MIPGMTICSAVQLRQSQSEKKWSGFTYFNASGDHFAKHQKEVYAAQFEAAQAKAELAQLELDRLTLRAPFAGRITALPVSSGQYVLKGTVIAELADVTSLKSLVPVDRRTVSDR